MHCFVLGNTGSGKSTLARRVAKARQMAHVDLDPYAWTETVGDRRDLENSLQALRPKLAQRPSVVEGMYSDLVAGLLTSNDTLVWLDLPLEQCRAHCEARPFEPHKWATSERQDAFLPQLLEFLETYPTRTDALGQQAHRQLFAEHDGRKSRLTTARQASDWLPPESQGTS